MLCIALFKYIFLIVFRFFLFYFFFCKCCFWIPCEAINSYSKTESQCWVWFIVDNMMGFFFLGTCPLTLFQEEFKFYWLQPSLLILLFAFHLQLFWNDKHFHPVNKAKQCWLCGGYSLYWRMNLWWNRLRSFPVIYVELVFLWVIVWFKNKPASCNTSSEKWMQHRVFRAMAVIKSCWKCLEKLNCH